MVMNEPVVKRLGRFFVFHLVDLFSMILPSVYPTKNQLSFPVKNILVIELAMLGDMLLTTPLLASIKNCFPHSKMTVLCTPWSKEAIINNPNVNDMMTYEAFWEDRSTKAKPAMKHFISTIKLMRYFLFCKSFDIAFIVTSREQPFVMLMGYLSGARIRVGTKYPLGYRFLTHTIHDDNTHIMELKKRLLKAVCPNFQDDKPIYYGITEESREKAKGCIKESFGSYPIPYICITPSTLQVEKQWKIELWANLINKLNGEGVNIFLGGNRSDYSYVKTIHEKAANPDLCKNITGKFSLNQFAAVLEKSIGVVTVESASMHLAAALNLPCVVLFSRVYNYHKFKPTHSSAKIMLKEVDCFDCQKGCKNPVCMDFSVEEVYQETMQMIHRSIQG